MDLATNPLCWNPPATVESDSPPPNEDTSRSNSLSGEITKVPQSPPADEDTSPGREVRQKSKLRLTESVLGGRSSPVIPFHRSSPSQKSGSSNSDDANSVSGFNSFPPTDMGSRCGEEPEALLSLHCPEDDFENSMSHSVTSSRPGSGAHAGASVNLNASTLGPITPPSPFTKEVLRIFPAKVEISPMSAFCTAPDSARGGVVLTAKMGNVQRHSQAGRWMDNGVVMWDRIPIQFEVMATFEDCMPVLMVMARNRDPTTGELKVIGKQTVMLEGVSMLRTQRRSQEMQVDLLLRSDTTAEWITTGKLYLHVVLHAETVLFASNTPESLPPGSQSRPHLRDRPPMTSLGSPPSGIRPSPLSPLPLAASPGGTRLIKSATPQRKSSLNRHSLPLTAEKVEDKAASKSYPTLSPVSPLLDQDMTPRSRVRVWGETPPTLEASDSPSLSASRRSNRQDDPVVITSIVDEPDAEELSIDALNLSTHSSIDSSTSNRKGMKGLFDALPGWMTRRGHDGSR